jgi:hypothetical protein
VEESVERELQRCLQRTYYTGANRAAGLAHSNDDDGERQEQKHHLRQSRTCFDDSSRGNSASLYAEAEHLTGDRHNASSVLLHELLTVPKPPTLREVDAELAARESSRRDPSQGDAAFDAAMRSLLKKFVDTTGRTERSYHEHRSDPSRLELRRNCEILKKPHTHHRRHSKQPPAGAAVGGDTPVTARMKAKFSEADVRLTALEEGFRRAAAMHPLDVNSSGEGRHLDHVPL